MNEQAYAAARVACVETLEPLELGAVPHATPIYLTSVYRCPSPAAAAELLAGERPGFAYSRDGQPNKSQLERRLARLHRAEHAAVAPSGMAALGLALVSQIAAGDHVVLSERLYGRTLQLFGAEAARLGMTSTLVDPCDLTAMQAAVTERTKLMVVETVANPTLRVADISALAEIAHAAGARLLVDNTFAGPLVCQPLTLGADLVVESLTKMIGGHSDLLLGALCGNADAWERVANAQSRWGFSPAAFDCYLAERSLATLPLRCERASDNALAVAQWLRDQPQVAAVQYPGLSNHPDHEVAKRMFLRDFGAMIAFDLAGGRPAVDQAVDAMPIPFCPSLGEVGTTVTHPLTTSHRGLSADEAARLDISPGTLRLNVGTEPVEWILDALRRGLTSGAG